MGFHSIKATDTFEVEVELTGTYLPGRRETPASYAHGGLPAEPEMMEDVEVVSLSGLRRTAGGWTRVDLLGGIDKAARERILANIADFIAESAQEQLLAALPEEE